MTDRQTMRETQTAETHTPPTCATTPVPNGLHLASQLCWLFRWKVGELVQVLHIHSNSNSMHSK